MASDTSPQTRERHLQLMRALTPERRFLAATAMSTGVRQLVFAGLRDRYPHANEDELRRRFAARVYGRTTAERLYGAIPEDAD
jgi:hypothetical protein